jgi:hypothetical protein
MRALICRAIPATPSETDHDADRCHGDRPDGRGDEQRPRVAGEPELDEDRPQPVQGVDPDRRDERDVDERVHVQAGEPRTSRHLPRDDPSAVDLQRHEDEQRKEERGERRESPTVFYVVSGILRRY